MSLLVQSRVFPESPQEDSLVARARALAPQIQASVEAVDQLRDVPAETIKAIHEAGLFRIFQPTRWGGLQHDPRMFFDIQNALAEVCASTAWVYGVLCVQSFLLTLFDEQAQADVWGENAEALISSSFQPTGKVEVVKGGFRLSGRWTFSSGSSHAQWALVGAMIPPQSDGGQSEMRLFLVPRKDYEIIDTWHTFGLRGTGSNDLLIQGAFVPAYRTYRPDAGLIPGRSANEGRDALYCLPWLYIFSSSISNFSIGAARGALRAFLAAEQARASRSRAVAGEDVIAQRAAARLHAEIDAAEAMYRRHIEYMLHCVEVGASFPLEDGYLYRTQLTSVVRKLAAHVDELMLLLGGRGIRMDSPLTRVWLDLTAARAHPGNDPALAGGFLGKSLMDSNASD